MPEGNPQAPLAVSCVRQRLSEIKKLCFSWIRERARRRQEEESSESAGQRVFGWGKSVPKFPPWSISSAPHAPSACLLEAPSAPQTPAQSWHPPSQPLWQRASWLPYLRAHLYFSLVSSNPFQSSGRAARDFAEEALAQPARQKHQAKQRSRLSTDPNMLPRAAQAFPGATHAQFQHAN